MSPGASNVIGKPVLHICFLLVAAMAAAGCSTLENTYKCRSADPDTRIAGCTALIQASQGRGENLYLIYNNRGTAYSHKGNHAVAIQDFSEAIHLNPSYAILYNNRGLDYYEERDYDHAIQDFSEAIRRNANYASAYYYRGDAYDNKADYDHATHDYDEAIQNYNEAIRLNPRYAFAYYGRGLAFDSRGTESDNRDDYDRAIQDYNEAIRLRPNDAGTHRYRGLAYDHKGDYDQAIQDLNEATRLNPKDTVAYLGRGATYIRKDDYDRAIQNLDEAIRLNSKDTISYQVRGYANFFQSNLTAAISDFESAISGAPSPRMAVSTALMLHLAMKRQGSDDARQLAQIAAAADLSKWPGPVLKLDMGKMSAAEVLAAANNPGDERQKWHVCEANYFTGEDALLHSQRATAFVRLKAARDGCPKWDLEYVAALIELKRLGVPPTSSK